MTASSVIRVTTLLVLFSIITACASLSEEQCLIGDWQQYGREDGAHGRSHNLHRHTKACSKHGVTPNAEQYEIGRNEGLETYCTYENGVLEGQKGAYYKNVCPGARGLDFLDGYTPSREVHLTEESIERKRDDIARHRRIASDHEINEADRYDARMKVRTYKSDLERLYRDLRQQKRDVEISHLDHDIRILESRLPHTPTTHPDWQRIQYQIEGLQQQIDELRSLELIDTTTNLIIDLVD